MSDELEKAASRVIILRKAAQMPRQFPDTLGQQSDLDFGRTCIALVELEILNGF